MMLKNLTSGQSFLAKRQGAPTVVAPVCVPARSTSCSYSEQKASCSGRKNSSVCRASDVSYPSDSPSEETNRSNERGGFSPEMRVPLIVCAQGDMGSGSSLGATISRSKMQFIMPSPVVQGPKLDDGGSGGGIGKSNHNGGGGGDGGDDDDDDYSFGEDGEGDGEGDAARNALFRTLIPESYDKLSIGAVFAEWMRTVADLPLILRRAVEMGLFSSAQLVRFLSMDVRPNLTRTISRTLPPNWARGFVGRMMADPAFSQKLVLETLVAGIASMVYEVRARGDKITKELDLAAINSLGLAAATGATVWLLAPTRSYGAVHKFPWQSMLEGLPNHVFDASSPLRSYTGAARVGAFFARMAELSAVGAAAGSATAALSAAAIAIRRRSDPDFQPSIEAPSIGRSSAGLAAYYALNMNTRYQLLGGLDRYLFDHTNFLWTYLGASMAMRAGSLSVGEMSRSWWQGLPDASALEAQRTTATTASRQVRVRKVRKVRRVIANSGATTLAATDAAAIEGAAPALEAAPAEGAPAMESPVTMMMAPEVDIMAASTPLELSAAPVATQQS